MIWVRKGSSRLLRLMRTYISSWPTCRPQTVPARFISRQLCTNISSWPPCKAHALPFQLWRPVFNSMAAPSCSTAILSCSTAGSPNVAETGGWAEPLPSWSVSCYNHKMMMPASHQHHSSHTVCAP